MPAARRYGTLDMVDDGKSVSVSCHPIGSFTVHNSPISDTGSERTIPAANYSARPRVTRRAPRDSHKRERERSCMA